MAERLLRDPDLGTRIDASLIRRRKESRARGGWGGVGCTRMYGLAAVRQDGRVNVGPSRLEPEELKMGSRTSSTPWAEKEMGWGGRLEYVLYRDRG